MKKVIFSTQEAHLVAFPEDPATVNLQLHQWKKSGELMTLKRGLFMFADAEVSVAEIAKRLYSPCYLSLEYALSLYGIIPEAVFIYTLVTTKSTRRFEVPKGIFIYQKILREAFTGFHPKTLLAEKEKALVDYFYLQSAHLKPTNTFWEASRLEGKATDINFKKAFRYAKLFHSKKLNILLTSFSTYVQSHQTHR